MPIKKTRSKKKSVAKRSRISKLSATEESCLSFANVCSSSPNIADLSRKPLSELKAICERKAIEKKETLYVNHVNRVDTLVKKIMMFKMSISPDIGNSLTSAPYPNNADEESVLDISKLKPTHPSRCRKRTVAFKGDACKRPELRTTSRSSSRKRIPSASRFKTPVVNKKPPISSAMVITPKMNLNTPLSVLRRPKQGEMAVSMSGSPLLVSSVTHDETPSISVPLPDGKVLSILPNMGFEPDDIPYLDRQTRQQLETLKSHLQFYCRQNLK